MKLKNYLISGKKSFKKGVFMKNTLKNTIKVFGLSALAALIVFAMAGCGSKKSGDPSSPAIPVLLGISVNSESAKTVYHIGDELDINGLVVNAAYSDNTSKVVDNDTLEISGFDSSESGDKELLIEWNGMFAEYTITVDEVPLDRIEITANPANTVYFTGDVTDHTGLKVTAIYCYEDGSNESRVELNNDLLSISDIKTDVSGNQNLSVSYGGKDTQFAITMNVLMSIAITEKPALRIHKVGYPLNLDGLEVKATYFGTDSSTSYLDITEENISGFNSETTGENTIIINYHGKIDTFKVTVQNYVTFFPSSGYWGDNTSDTEARTAWVSLETKTVANPGKLSKRYHTLDGWYIEGTERKWDSADKIISDIVLKAEWELNTLTSIDGIKGYLATLDKNSVDNPASLPVKIDLGNMSPLGSGWQELLTALKDAYRFVSLDLSQCTMSNTDFSPYSKDADGKDKIVNMVLPDVVKVVKSETFPNAAFQGFDNLESITFGKNVTAIGENVLYSSEKLTLVTCYAVKPPTLGKKAFGNSRPALEIKVPAASIFYSPELGTDVYEMVWKEYKDSLGAI